MKRNKESVEIVCPRCKNTKIVYLDGEDFPKCEKCRVQMVLREVLREGKST